MKVDIRRKRTRIFVLTQLLVLTMLCFTLYAVSVGVKRSGRTAGAEQTATYMNIESYDLEWDANRSLRQAVGKATIYGGGNFVESYEKPAMTVWHFPKVADVKLNADVRRYYNQGTAQLYFRIVHEHARTGLNEVVFPYDGSWYDLNVNNSDGTGPDTLNVEEYFNVAAGDKIKIIIKNENNGSWCTAYLNGRISFIYDGGSANGLNVSYSDSSVAYADSNTADAILPENLHGYYGVNSVKSDVLTYEYINACSDHNDSTPVVSESFDYYDVSVIKSQAGSVYGSELDSEYIIPVLNPNMSGAEFIAFDVENGLGGDAYAGMDLIIADVSGYGAVWTAAAYNAVYIDAGDGVKKIYDLHSGKYNRGGALIPAGFNGTVIIPVESFERMGNRYGKDIFGKTGDFKNVDFENVSRADLVISPVVGESYSAGGILSVNNFKILGTVIESVTLSENRAIRAIMNIGEVNYGSEKLIASARRIYDSLTAEERLLVHNAGDLLAAESKFAKLSDYSGYVGSHGKDFTNGEGVSFEKVFLNSVSAVAAWVKVPSDLESGTHIGTVVGNMAKTAKDNGLYDSDNSFSMEINGKGNPRFIWRISEERKTYFTVKNVDVRTNKWTHIAFVKDKSGLIQCYVNGVAVSKLYVEADRAGDISMKLPVMIGSDYTDDPVLSVGENPKFKGLIANVRIYSNTLTSSDVMSDLKGVKAGNALGYVDFSSGEHGNYYDRAGVGAVDAYGWKTAEQSDFELSDGFTVAVFGSTQATLSKAVDDAGRGIYDANYDYTTNAFYKNVRWLIDNKIGLDLRFVLHAGSLTNNLNNEFAATSGIKELEYGVGWMEMLSESGIRWSLSRGYKDGGFDATDVGLYDERYSYSAYSSVADGTFCETNMRSAYYTFDSGNTGYLVIVLDVLPTDEELEWANAVIAANSGRRVIISTHSYIDEKGNHINTTGAIGRNSGADVWDKCASRHRNVIMVLSGNTDGIDPVKSESVGIYGNTVYEIMINPTVMEFYGSRQTGVFALMKFAGDGSRIDFTYYSATENKFFRSCNSFSVEIEPIEYGTDYLKKEGLVNVILPTVRAFAGANGRMDVWGQMYVEENGAPDLGMNSNNFGIKDPTYGYAVAFDTEANGVFRFKDTAYVKTNANSWFYLSVFVVDKDTGLSKRWFPKDQYITVPSASEKQGLTVRDKSVEYVIRGESQSFSLSEIGGLAVNGGDKIIVFMQSHGVNYAKFDAELTYGENVLKSYSTGDAFNYASVAASAVITGLFNAGFGQTDSNGNPVNFNGITAGYYRTYQTGGTSYAPFKYVFKIVDVNNDLLYSAISAGNAEIILPSLSKCGHIFIGYGSDGSLYPEGYALAVSGNKTVTAVFAKFGMTNGASVRLNLPEGIRFSAHVNESDYNYLNAIGAITGFGTIIAKADDVISGGKVDYSLLRSGTTVKHVDLKNTVNKISYGNFTFNAALVGIGGAGYEDKFVARSYMTVKYADGSEKIFYAFLTDNQRSVAEVARKALAEFSEVYSEVYSVYSSGVYVKYDARATAVLREFAGGG